MDTVFNITVSLTGTIGGHAHAQRVAITSADVVNMFIVQVSHCQQHDAASVLQFQVDAATGNPINNAHGNPVQIMEEHVQKIRSSFDI